MADTPQSTPSIAPEQTEAMKALEGIGIKYGGPKSGLSDTLSFTFVPAMSRTLTSIALGREKSGELDQDPTASPAVRAFGQEAVDALKQLNGGNALPSLNDAAEALLKDREKLHDANAKSDAHHVQAAFYYPGPAKLNEFGEKSRDNIFPAAAPAVPAAPVVAQPAAPTPSAPPAAPVPQFTDSAIAALRALGGDAALDAAKQMIFYKSQGQDDTTPTVASAKRALLNAVNTKLTSLHDPDSPEAKAFLQTVADLHLNVPSATPDPEKVKNGYIVPGFKADMEAAMKDPKAEAYRTYVSNHMLNDNPPAGVPHATPGTITRTEIDTNASNLRLVLQEVDAALAQGFTIPLKTPDSSRGR